MVDPNFLKKKVESFHSCTAQIVQCVPVRIESIDLSVYDATVYIFDLEGHPATTRAYAWASPIGCDGERRFFAVLHYPPIESPTDAVRAVVVIESDRTTK